MVDTGIFLRQLSLACSLVVFSAIILAVTGILLNGIVRTFLHVWKKMPNIGNSLDKLSRVRLNHKVASRRKKAPAKKPVRGNVILKPATTKQQGVGHV